MPSNGIEAKGQLGYPDTFGRIAKTSAGMPLDPSIIQINIPILEYSSSKSWYSRNLLAIHYSDGDVSLGSKSESLRNAFSNIDCNMGS